MGGKGRNDSCLSCRSGLSSLSCQRAHFLDDVLRRNPESLEQLLWFSTARDLANREAADGQTRSGDRFRDRVADPPRRVVIFHRDQPSLGGATSLDEAVPID